MSLRAPTHPHRDAPRCLACTAGHAAGGLPAGEASGYLPPRACGQDGCTIAAACGPACGIGDGAGGDVGAGRALGKDAWRQLARAHGGAVGVAAQLVLNIHPITVPWACWKISHAAGMLLGACTIDMACASWMELVQVGWSLCKLDRACASWIELVQDGSSLCKSNRACASQIELLQVGLGSPGYVNEQIYAQLPAMCRSPRSFANGRKSPLASPVLAYQCVSIPCPGMPISVHTLSWHAQVCQHPV
eukprot:350396-Chlamydomonas_euryale.AAC.9